MKLFYSATALALLTLFFTPTIAASQVYFLNGPAEIDLSGCSVNGAQGSVSVTFTVLRVAAFAKGNAHVEFFGLPTTVTVSIAPAELDFAGGVWGQQVVATFTAGTGVFIADNIIKLRISDDKNTNEFLLFLHGTCPRHNKDFTVTGFFVSNYRGKMFPVEGALVAIYQDKSWAIDPRVGDYVQTGSDGSFSVNIHTNDEGTFYAKCLMNDGQGVYLRDWYTAGIKDYNSATRGNNDLPVLDLGGTMMVRDDGATISKSSIWQGGRAAFQEFIQTTRTPPPTGDYELVIQNTINNSVWTARSTTNWEDKHETRKFDNVEPLAPSDPGYDAFLSPFNNYSVNFHEFGHALRHTVDGDQRHFLNDAERWTYARKHDWCGSSPWVDVEGFAFNEGWAEYWSRDPTDAILFNCSSLSVTDMTKEGAVAIDLNNIEASLGNCLKLTTPLSEKEIRRQRKGMWDVLNRGDNIIHSDGEFRDNYLQQFAPCVLLPAGIGVTVSTVITPVQLKYNRPKQEFFTAMQHLISNQELISAQLLLALKTAETKQKELHCKVCDTVVAVVIGPEILKGKIAYSNLILQTYKKRLETFSRPGVDTLFYNEAFLTNAAKELAAFKQTLHKIVSSCLKRSIACLNKYHMTSAGETENALAYFSRQLKLLDINTPANNEWYDMLSLPPNAYDDKAVPVKDYKYIKKVN